MMTVGWGFLALMLVTHALLGFFCFHAGVGVGVRSVARLLGGR
jgi:hypothetical protein